MLIGVLIMSIVITVYWEQWDVELACQIFSVIGPVLHCGVLSKSSGLPSGFGRRFAYCFTAPFSPIKHLHILLCRRWQAFSCY